MLVGRRRAASAPVETPGGRDLAYGGRSVSAGSLLIFAREGLDRVSGRSFSLVGISSHGSAGLHPRITRPEE
jgi:hypothetical protein